MIDHRESIPYSLTPLLPKMNVTEKMTERNAPLFFVKMVVLATGGRAEYNQEVPSAGRWKDNT